MATKKELDSKSVEELTPEEMKQRILTATYQREMLQLDQVEEDNKRRQDERIARSANNAQRQADLAAIKQTEEAIQQVCRHRQGGNPQNIYKGDGKPCVTRALMLDGYTYFLQCTRCRLRVYTPHPNLEERDPAEFAKQKAVYDRLWEMSQDSGLDEIRGPNFFFRKNGIPFIPERV